MAYVSRDTDGRPDRAGPPAAHINQEDMHLRDASAVTASRVLCQSRPMLHVAVSSPLGF
jgi:hypothetical protein